MISTEWSELQNGVTAQVYAAAVWGVFEVSEVIKSSNC